MTEESTWSDKEAVCPYCGHNNCPSVSEGILYDESTDTYECGLCEREFAVSVHVSYSWSCKPCRSTAPERS